MTNRRTLKFSLFAVGLIALFMPVMASAQGGYDPWGRNRNDNYGRYDQRQLRDSIHRLDRLAREFERDLDRALITVAPTALAVKTTSTTRPGSFDML